MSFRATLFLSIVAAVMAAAFIEAGLDFVADRAQSYVENQIADDLDRYGDAVEAQLLASLASPALPARMVIDTPLRREVRYRIMRDDRLLFASTPPEVPDEGAWTSEVRHLMDGYRVEVGVSSLLFERFLASELVADIIDLPLFFVLGFCVAWLLGRIVMRPVRELTTASQQLAAQQFPEPIKVPPGNDELSKMARSFNVMTASIRGFMERERTFTRYASHELRTPLSALKAQVEAAQLGISSPEAVLPALERNITRMEAVLGALLTLARSGQHEREEGDLAPLLLELRASLPAQARRRIRVELAHAPMRVPDKQLAAQALRNLVDNALEYSRGLVTLEATSDEETVRVVVRDEGGGVPESLLNRLREPFFRASERAGGLGLGLSLVDGIAQSLGGKLEFRNLERGFEATLTLPRPHGLPPGQTEGGAGSPAAPASPVDGPGKPGKRSRRVAEG